MENGFSLSLGAKVLYNEQPHIIKEYLSLTSFLLLNPVTGVEVIAELTSISSIKNESTSSHLIDTGIARLLDKIWQEAERRANLIRPLSNMSVVPATLANEVAEKLAVT